MVFCFLESSSSVIKEKKNTKFEKQETLRIKLKSMKGWKYPTTEQKVRTAFISIFLTEIDIILKHVACNNPFKRQIFEILILTTLYVSLGKCFRLISQIYLWLKKGEYFNDVLVFELILNLNFLENVIKFNFI